jgi:hypothetical protein
MVPWSSWSLTGRWQRSPPGSECAALCSLPGMTSGAPPASGTGRGPEEHRCRGLWPISAGGVERHAARTRREPQDRHRATFEVEKAGGAGEAAVFAPWQPRARWRPAARQQPPVEQSACRGWHPGRPPLRIQRKSPDRLDCFVKRLLVLHSCGCQFLTPRAGRIERQSPFLQEVLSAAEIASSMRYQPSFAGKRALPAVDHQQGPAGAAEPMVAAGKGGNAAGGQHLTDDEVRSRANLAARRQRPPRQLLANLSTAG